MAPRRKDGGISSGAAEEATGIPRETLRAWERRFGFPMPTRLASGHRRYAVDDVLKLREIARLLGAGFRPKAVISLPLARLRELGRATTSDQPFLALGNVLLEAALPVLRHDGAAALQEHFDRLLAQRGLEAFVLRCARPLAVAIGEAWCGGALHVFEEHVITEHLERTIWRGLEALPGHRGPPLVALATLNPERHTLGLLMVNAVLTLAGSSCLWVGPAAVAELTACVRQHGVDIVALSFSAYFPQRRLDHTLGELRRQLPARTGLWAGGSGVAHLDSPPPGVMRMMALEDLPAALRGPTGAGSH